jgi:hypothetical protein
MAWLALALALAAHAVQSARIWPSARALLDPEAPVVSVDHALHLDHGGLAAGFLRARGRVWGYDPAFMAGYPVTPLWDSSSNLSLLFHLLAGSSYAPLAYKLGLLVCGLAVVPLVAVAAGLAGLELAAVALAAWLAFLYAWVGFAHSAWISGLFSFVTASALAVVLLGALVWHDRRPTRASWITVALVGTLAFWAHVTFPIVVGGGLVGYLLGTARRHGARWRLGLVAAAAVALVVNSPWLIPLWQFRSLRTGTGFFLTTDTAWYLPVYYLSEPTDGRLGLAIFVLGLGGLCRWIRRGQTVVALTFGMAVLALALLAALGSLWSATRVLEPLRFRISLSFLMVVPAATALDGLARAIARACGGGLRGLAGIGLAAGSAVALVILFLPDTARGIPRALGEPSRLSVGIRPVMQRLVDTLRAETDTSARILLEDQLRLLEPTVPESTHWTPLLPVLLKNDRRMFLGGLYHSAFIAQHEATRFGDFHLGDRRIDEWSPAELNAFLARYNIGWVVTWSPLSRFVFDRLPTARPVADLPRFATPGYPVPAAEVQWRAMVPRIGAEAAYQALGPGAGLYRLYRIDRPYNFAITGTVARAEGRPDRVDLHDVRPAPDGQLVVALHWQSGMISDPPLPLEPVQVPGDRVPFVGIRLDRPLDHLAIVLRPGALP